MERAGIALGRGAILTTLSKVLPASLAYFFTALVGSVSRSFRNSGSRHAFAWIWPQSFLVGAPIDLSPFEKGVDYAVQGRARLRP
jgi:hypothetical protein